MKFLKLLFTLFAIAMPAFTLAAPVVTAAPDVLLTEKNHVVIRGEVNGESVSKWILELNNIKDKDVVVYINSPGGSVLAGMTFVEQIQQMTKAGKNVVCVADVAASMAFIILQSCPNRYVTSASILMQHQMSLKLGGQIENVKTYLNFLDGIEEDLNLMQAKKMDMDPDDFKRLIAHDLWLSGSSIMKHNAADKMVHVGCDSVLLTKVHKEEIDTFFGTIVLTYSKCPLARDPVDSNFKGINDLSIINELMNKYIPSLAIKNLSGRNSVNHYEF
jgi:ATP-dependent Clp protease, protease subunit